LGAEGWQLKAIRDGLSNTLMLAEVRTRDQVQDQRGAWALPWTGSSLLSVDLHPHPTCWPSKPFKPNPYSFGQTQMPNNQGPPPDMLYACVDEAGAQLERMPCATYDPEVGVNHFLSAAPRSFHPGGVNAVFCDGHTTFLPNEIDEVVMAYLVSANDGQPVHFDDHAQ
jgi:prepilin-type processing-associated H-X9-DG protein